MARINWKLLVKALVAVVLVIGVVVGFADVALAKNRSPRSQPAKPTKIAGKISETAPPIALQALRPALDEYQPQVSILSPKQNEVLTDNTVSIQLQVKDLPVFKDQKLGLGSHLHAFLDDRPYQAVYDTSQPLKFEKLDPGTHTLRVFASRPWHESFKNDGAYAQTTFHVFAKTNEHSPDPALPLLTYSRPQGSYGAEPIMLDFYLTNAPLHLVAQENPKDDIADWRIRCTVNGESFLLDRWQPIYLKGFQPGKNWVQLEFLDEKGNPVNNVFNNTARLVTYEPGGKDTLSKLVRGELAAEAARGIVDPNYVPEVDVPKANAPKDNLPEVVPPVPTPIVTPAPSPAPVISPPPTASPTPEVLPSPSPIVPVVKSPETVKPETAKPQQTELEPSKKPEPTASPAVKPPSLPKSGFFDRFRSSSGSTKSLPEAKSLPPLTEPTAPLKGQPESKSTDIPVLTPPQAERSSINQSPEPVRSRAIVPTANPSPTMNPSPASEPVSPTSEHQESSKP